MGYFSNGTEGEMFVETYCHRCVNWRDLDDGRGPGCPVWDAHLLFAYEECDSGSNAKVILDMLIPRRTITNECAMFVEVPA
jgi:hypothetical protein